MSDTRKSETLNLATLSLNVNREKINFNYSGVDHSAADLWLTRMKTDKFCRFISEENWKLNASSA